MIINILSAYHPLYSAQAELIKGIPDQNKNEIESIISNYFNTYNIDDSETIANEKFITLQKAINPYFNKNHGFFKRLNEFDPKHISYYRALAKLNETLECEFYDSQLRNAGKNVLDAVISCRRWRPSDAHESIYTRLLNAVNTGIQSPDDTNNFNDLITLLPQLPKQRFYPETIIATLLGSLMVFVGLVGIAVAAASVITTAGATLPAAAIACVAFISSIAAGSYILHNREDFGLTGFGPLIKMSEKDSIRNLTLFSTSFKEKLETHSPKVTLGLS